MNKLFAFILVLLSMHANAQKTPSPKSNQSEVSIKDSSNKIKISYQNKDIEITKQKLDSMINSVWSSFQNVINDPDNQKMFKESLTKVESKLNQMVDILVEDNDQKAQAKKDIKSGIEKSKPLMDSLVKKVNSKN